jgi:2-keto-4-pentenoate hydratase
VPRIRHRDPELDVAGAYAIQRVNLHRGLVAGATLVGHEIGLTSKPMQTLLGVEEPDFGFILDDMVVETNSVAVERFCAPRVEPEVAFLLHAPLRGPHVGPDDVRAATAAVAWLANALADYGTELEAGQFVMSGSFTSAAFVRASDTARAIISGLGAVSLAFE